VRPIQEKHYRVPIEKHNNATNGRHLESDSSDVFIPEASKRWISLITAEERRKYEEMIKLKNSFAISLGFLPKSFSPENPEYFKNVSQIVKLMSLIAGFFLALVIIFLVIRFGFKKCVGPTKVSQVNKNYRNTTWIIFSKNIYLLFSLFFYRTLCSVQLYNYLLFENKVNIQIN
jgi:hypothetical protein